MVTLTLAETLPSAKVAVSLFKVAAAGLFISVDQGEYQGEVEDSKDALLRRFTEVGMGVGLFVGIGVGVAVGKGVGVAVGKGVGDNTGTAVGVDVEMGVGESVRPKLLLQIL